MNTYWQDYAQSASRSKDNIVYLACPYTDASADIRLRRFEAATQAAAFLIKQGRIVYSPITMTHPIDLVLAGASNTLGSDYWVSFDEAFMKFCSEVVILTIDGWQRSKGVQREIEHFISNNKPVFLLDPKSMYESQYNS